MKVKTTKEMCEKIHVGIVIASFSLGLYFVLMNFKMVSNTWNSIISVLFPFIIGFAFAFLLNPIMMFFEVKVFKSWNCKGKGKRVISMFIALLIAVAIIALMCYLITPAIVESVKDLVSNNEVYIHRFTDFVTNIFKGFNLDDKSINTVVGQGSNFLDQFGNVFSSTFPAIISTSYGIIKALLNVLIGIAAAMYLLLDKEHFFTLMEKTNYAVFPKQVANYLKNLVHVICRVFYDFIIGKAIDSFIIGIICYVGLSILGIEYAALLSVIVAVTNMIPVFGPFIGAVPGVLILLIINPIQSLYFAIFILALQQFDGNILGPLILGDKLGLPSFWILFSVTVGGSLLGIVGMFIGVPTFAIIYYGIQEYLNFRLEKKQIIISPEKDSL